jgi:integrase
MKRRTRGAGEVFREPGRQWAFRWREHGRRCYSGGHPTKEIAERALALVRGQLAHDRADLPPDPRGVPKLSVLAEPFLTRRETTHRAWEEDRIRWKKHLLPHFGHLRPNEVDQAGIRGFIEAKLGSLAPGTIRVCVALLSSLLMDLVERKLAPGNPARGLPKATMRLMRSDYDPRTTPFVERLQDVRRILLALPEPLDTAYAIGVLAGLRTGEVFAVRWPSVDLQTRRIHVRESVKGPLKDKDSRIVPIQESLLPLLTAWRLKSGGEGRVIPSMRIDGAKVDDKHTPGRRLQAVLQALGLARPGFGMPGGEGGEKKRTQKLWYWCTRHTFASQWVMAGGSIEKLSKVMGHYSITVTERYAHLKPELFTAQDHRLIAYDMTPGEQEVLVFPEGERERT